MFACLARPGALITVLVCIVVPSMPARGGDVGAAGADASQQADALVDSVLEAYGGLESIRAVEAYRLEATMQAHSRGQQARTIRISEGVRRLQVMISYPDGAEIRIVDGDRGHSGSSLETLAPAAGPALSAMTLQAARAHVPWILDAMRSRVTGVAVEGPYDGLEIRFSDAESLRLLVEPQTHFIVTAESTVRAGGMNIAFRTDFSDFRRVGGILFAFHEENFAAGTHTATTTVERVVLNPAGDELRLPRDGLEVLPGPTRSPGAIGGIRERAGSRP